MTAALENLPFIDPRVEFWSNRSQWPRDFTGFVFLPDVVHDLGRLLYGVEWTGNEPSVQIVYPIRHVLDTATTAADIALATTLLEAAHAGYQIRAQSARAIGQPLPMPTADEWPIAYALSRQVADTIWTQYMRYVGVMTTLVRLFELGIVTAARRNHQVGPPIAIASHEWINEVYPSWFATCQIDPERPFSGIPIRDGGDWIYVDIASYVAWRNASFGALTPTHAGKPLETKNEPQAGSQPADQDPISKPKTSCTDTAAAAPKPKARRGAKPRYDWKAFDAEVLRLAKEPNRPTSIHAFADAIASWCLDRWGREPSNSRLRSRISRVLADNGINLDEPL